MKWNPIGLYPILDMDYCESKQIDPEKLIKIWEEFPFIIDCFQIRAKNSSVENVKKTWEYLRTKTNLRIIVNDHWKLAIEVGADGFHLGKEDYALLTESEKDQIRESSLWKGTSSHSISDLLSLEAHWDYTGFGPIFPTTSKQTQNLPLGKSTLEEAIRISKIPLVPIGGIDMENFLSIALPKVTKPAGISLFAQEKDFYWIANKYINS